MLKELLKTSDYIKWSETSIKQENQREFNICYLRNKSNVVTNYVSLIY